MKTEDKMDTKKKVYNTPELMEHGTLVEMTQGEGGGGWDGTYGSQAAKMFPQ